MNAAQRRRQQRQHEPPELVRLRAEVSQLREHVASDALTIRHLRNRVEQLEIDRDQHETRAQRAEDFNDTLLHKLRASSERVRELEEQSKVQDHAVRESAGAIKVQASALRELRDRLYREKERSAARLDKVRELEREIRDRDRRIREIGYVKVGRATMTTRHRAQEAREIEYGRAERLRDREKRVRRRRYRETRIEAEQWAQTMPWADRIERLTPTARDWVWELRPEGD